MFENYVILEEVDWEWIILKKKLFEIYIQIVENYTILGEKRLNSRWLNCIHELSFFILQLHTNMYLV